jgi:hypothetical protein
MPQAIERLRAVVMTMLFCLTIGSSNADDGNTVDHSLTTVERAVMRRLNRTQYEYTVRDLLGIHLELKEMLPEESAAGGFDNVGDALHVSSFLMERYLDAAEKSLHVAIANQPQPPFSTNRYSLKEERAVKTATEKVYLHRDDSLVMFSSSAWNAITVGQFYPSHRGNYRIRISAYAYQSDGKPVSFRVDAGPMLMGTKNHLVGYFDAQPNKPSMIEFEQHFEARSHIRISPYGLANAQTVNRIGADHYTGPGLGIESIEVEGPLHTQWPPVSHQRIFGNLPQGPVPSRELSKRVEVVTDDPVADAERVLRNFARLAFRRPVNDADIQPILQLVKSKQIEGRTFEQAVRTGICAILVSPEFLFLREPSGPLNDFAIASRLSYFLWCTLPDQELLDLAEQGAFTGDAASATLHAQVERLLKDSRAERFITDFVGQWLGLRDLDFTEPSHILYPEFDDLLKYSMKQETELFFAELLRDDLSIENFVASDFSMLNGRLAKHYGIPVPAALPRDNSQDNAALFHKVSLPENSHRGGVMTMASVLKVTANGTLTSPVTRGVWVLDRILDQKPSPPPDNVSPLEPDIRGATTMRQQLAKHRELAECASCHDEIDPLGFALENYDVIGGWRENYRTTGNGEAVTVDGRRMPYLTGKPVEPADVLVDGRAFRNIDELKQLLLADKKTLARAITRRLVTYATGAEPTQADRDAIEEIVQAADGKNYGLRSLIHDIVASPLFLCK